MDVISVTPLVNSDIDALVQIWNVYHLGSGLPTSSFVTLFPSDRLWVTSAATDTAAFHSAGSLYAFGSPVPGGLAEPLGHWLHFTTTAMFHLTGLAGSNFYATLAETTFLGIEHIPEPATGAMIASGLLALALGRSARRRRLMS